MVQTLTTDPDDNSIVDDTSDERQQIPLAQVTNFLNSKSSNLSKINALVSLLDGIDVSATQVEADWRTKGISAATNQPQGVISAGTRIAIGGVGSRDFPVIVTNAQQVIAPLYGYQEATAGYLTSFIGLTTKSDYPIMGVFVFAVADDLTTIFQFQLSSDCTRMKVKINRRTSLSGSLSLVPENGVGYIDVTSVDTDGFIDIATFVVAGITTVVETANVHEYALPWNSEDSAVIADALTDTDLASSVQFRILARIMANIRVFAINNPNFATSDKDVMNSDHFMSGLNKGLAYLAPANVFSGQSIDPLLYLGQTLTGFEWPSSSTYPNNLSIDVLPLNFSQTFGAQATLGATVEAVGSGTKINLGTSILYAATTKPVPTVDAQLTDALQDD
jgi:hypothetical protein